MSVVFHEALQEAGYDTELTLLDGADHNAAIHPGTEAFDVVVRHALASQE